MGRLKNLQLPATVEPHVREVIPPNERLHTVSDFIAMAGLVGLKEVPCTLALTDTALWILRWNGQSERRRWAQTVAVGFHEISQFTTQLVTMPIRNFYQLSFRLSGGALETTQIFKSPYVEGDAFIKQFQELLAGHRATPVSAADELAKLSALATEGVLSQDEWDRAKSLYLGKSPDAREEAVRLLRNLHEMQRNGILSEGEFNMKKWDVLSRLK